MFETITRAHPTAFHRAAQIAPATLNTADLTVDVVFTTGAAVRRSSVFAGDFIEELEVSPSAMRLERLNAGAPVLDSHDQYRLAAILGSVVPGSARVQGGEGICRIRLSGSEDTASIIDKVRSGHIRYVSVGYHVHVFERQRRTQDAELDTLLAIDWEPVEVSLVAVPADPGAHLRTGNTEMTRIIEAGAPRPHRSNALHNRAGIAPSGAAVEGDGGSENDDLRSRATPRRNPGRGAAVTVDMIREICGRSDDISRAFERGLIEDHEEEPLSRRELEERMANELIAVRQRPSVDVRGGGQREQRDSGQQMVRHFTEALAARLIGRDCPEEAREYRNAGLMDMARGLLEVRGERVRWMRNAQVLDQLTRSGAHTSSDFAGIISNAGRMYLIEAFNQAPSPLRALGRRRDFPDFKRRYAVQAEGPGGLRNVPEMGEYKRVSIQTGKNGAELKTYGEIFAITRQALINDDLGAFADFTRFWARAAIETEASLLVGMIQGDGQVMEEDGKTLYHADHGNVAAVGALPSVESLSLARQQLRTIKNRDGVTPANVTPRYLVVGAALETEAEKLLAEINAGTVDQVNPFSGRLELVVDPRLLGKSWRLFASPDDQPVLEYGNLEGEEGLFTDARLGFDVDGVEFKARTDLGAGLVDWRGTVLNRGPA